MHLKVIPTALGLVASTAATQKALGELSSLGVKDLRAIEDAAESFTNTWSGSTKAEFITAAYDVRSALSGLTDEAVGAFTAMAALTGKATKATTEEMVGTFTTAYGIFKPIVQRIPPRIIRVPVVRTVWRWRWRTRRRDHRPAQRSGPGREGGFFRRDQPEWRNQDHL